MRGIAFVGACVLGMSAAGIAQGPAVAQPGPAQASTAAARSGGMVWPSNLPAPVPLWPSGAPGALGSAEEDTPTLAAFIPASNPTKTAVVVAPGGSYTHLSMIKEGADVAQWLNAHGVAAFLLKYRLGPKYHNPIELGDAQRAMRTVRASAEKYGIAPDHIGMWGFSAGGHLTASAGTEFDVGKPDTADPIERQSSRPDFLILGYPVITMSDPYVHAGSRKFLLGDNPAEADLQLMSPELHVTPLTPPTFLFSTTDDKTVPVMNSILFYSALVKAGVPAEIHIFQHGAHGSGLAVANPQLRVWPDLLIKWMRERGYAAGEDGSVTAK
ncbi:MAG TPA: alpha/beta hydrolase [Acidobacteriaceae bacterium]|nr:alpha/beta hydrolase [Acidobacteriaceae bacterium]